MKNPLDTLFGRMALLSTLVLVVIQLGWFVLMVKHPPRPREDGFARDLLLAVRAANGGPVSREDLVRAWRIEAAPASAAPAAGAPGRHDPHMADVVGYLRRNLPAGSQVMLDRGRPPRLWVHVAGQAGWSVVPTDAPPPPPPRMVVESVSLLLAAIVLSILAAWQMQRPLSRVARAARTFGAGGRPAAVPERGPRELRNLISAFNDMMLRLNEADDDQAVMLAGVAHDLKTPLTRLKLRASLLSDVREGGDFLRDIDSLSNIVQQFLEFAGQSGAAGALAAPVAPIGVDAFLRRQFSSDSDNGAGQELFRLRLQAGEAFRLPGAVIDRLISNLVDNALEHGAPPIEIDSGREGSHWVLSVRDHGPGIPEGRIAAAMKPFVRLDAARGGEGHCGLGLAIVARLARACDGQCRVSNHPAGGLSVRIVLPA